MPKSKSLSRSASLPTRSKYSSVAAQFKEDTDDNELSDQERDEELHRVLQVLKKSSTEAKALFKKIRGKSNNKNEGKFFSFRSSCEELVETSVELKQLMGIKTKAEKLKIERQEAENDNFRHKTSKDLRQWNTGYEMQKRNKDELRKMKMEHDEVTERLRNEIDRYKEEKEQLLTRLSQIAGNKLRDNNPAVSDLSDPNRPLKLAEKTSELYDNEWTDAIEVLESDHDETSAVKILRSIIEKCYSLCYNWSELQLQTIIDSLLLDNKMQPDSSTTNQAKEIRKTVATWMMSDSYLHRKTWPYIEREIGSKDAERCRPFILKCIQYCWYMCIQDPPMYMKTFSKGEKFDSNEMKSFTKMGQYVEFTVWPAFYLYKKGPLLSKAIVQGSRSAALGSQTQHRSSPTYQPITTQRSERQAQTFNEQSWQQPQGNRETAQNFNNQPNAAWQQPQWNRETAKNFNNQPNTAWQQPQGNRETAQNSNRQSNAGYLQRNNAPRDLTQNYGGQQYSSTIHVNPSNYGQRKSSPQPNMSYINYYGNHARYERNGPHYLDTNIPNHQNLSKSTDL